MGKASLEDVLRNDTRTVEEMFHKPAPEDPEGPQIVMVPIDEITRNSRNFYGMRDIEDLAESIEVCGLMTPLSVAPVKNYVGGTSYKLISGHRRLEALRQLHVKSGGVAWREIPCVVLEAPPNDDVEELMLIHANSTSRKLNGYELAQEAKRVTEILTRMKENGADLPGRMRDHVAKALDVSRTKLARLSAIDNGITFPGWKMEWKDKNINENAAYHLSMCSKDQQAWVWDWAIEHRGRTEAITVGEIYLALHDYHSQDIKEPEEEPAPEADAEKEADPEDVSETDTEPRELPGTTDRIAHFEDADLLYPHPPAPVWVEGTPPANGRYLCTVDMGMVRATEQTCDYRGGEWMVYGRPVGEMFRVLYWWPLPKVYNGPITEEEDGEDQTVPAVRE